jgi:hypothetical protein
MHDDADNGPSSLGPWSPPMTIGVPVGAVLTGLPAGTGDVTVYRQFHAAGAADWTPADSVDSVTLPATSYTDIGTEY